MATMSGEAWDTFKVRPGNLPVRRLAAMSYLLLRYREKGLLSGLMDYLDGWQPESPRGLEAGLMVGAEGYWAAELDFGLPAGRSAPALLGRDRAAEIVVNVLLPFAAAWGNYGIAAGPGGQGPGALQRLSPPGREHAGKAHEAADGDRPAPGRLGAAAAGADPYLQDAVLARRLRELRANGIDSLPRGSVIPCLIRGRNDARCHCEPSRRSREASARVQPEGEAISHVSGNLADEIATPTRPCRVSSQ